MDTSGIQALTEFITTLVGEIPPELEGLFYIICVIVLLYVIDLFFMLLSSIFEVGKWKR